jgi:hypothetical protein
MMKVYIIHFGNRKANKLHWFKFPSNTLDKDENDLYMWFADGSMNT